MGGVVVACLSVFVYVKSLFFDASVAAQPQGVLDDAEDYHAGDEGEYSYYHGSESLCCDGRLYSVYAAVDEAPCRYGAE